MVNDDTIGASESWVALKTVPARWEAELIQSMLAAHDIPTRIVELGIPAYFGQGSPAAVRVRARDRWTAMLLTSSPESEDAS